MKSIFNSNKKAAIAAGLFALMALPFSAFSQMQAESIPTICWTSDKGPTSFDGNGQDTTKISLKNMKILIIADSNFKDSIDRDGDNGHSSHWEGIDLGFGGYLTKDNSTALPAGNDHLELKYSESVTWSLNFMEKDIRLVDEYVKVVTGLGIQFNHYSFENNTSWVNNADSLAWTTDTVNVFNRNKLKTTYLNLPLMLAFNTSKEEKKAFHLAAGVIVGYRIGSRYKQRYENEGDVLKPLVKSDFHQNPLRLNATTRIGFGKFQVFGTYALNTLFEKGRGLELYPFSLGVRLVGF